jgi:hypothetical protein
MHMCSRIRMERTQVLVDCVDGLETHHRRPSRMKRGGVEGGLLRFCVHRVWQEFKLRCAKDELKPCTPDDGVMKPLSIDIDDVAVYRSRSSQSRERQEQETIRLYFDVQYII